MVDDCAVLPPVRCLPWCAEEALLETIAIEGTVGRLVVRRARGEGPKKKDARKCD